MEISGTVDEESGGFAGVAWLAERGRMSSARRDYVIIPEPLNVDRICLGHRGVYWFESRRAAAPGTAACRFSASARSNTWASSSIVSSAS